MLKPKEILALVDSVDVPAELSGNTVKYFETFNCPKDEAWVVAWNLLTVARSKLAEVGLSVIGSWSSYDTVGGSIVEN